MSEVLGLYLVVGGVLALGILVIVIVAYVYVKMANRPTYEEKIAEDYANADLQRCNNRKALLSAALKHPAGSYERKRLLKRYDELAAAHEKVAKRGRERVADAAFPLEEEIRRLENGREGD